MNRMKIRTLLIAGITTTALIGLGACGQEHDDHRGRGDAPVAGHHGEDSPKHVTNNPDEFGNIATGCVAGAPGWRYFITTNTDKAPSNLDVRRDSSC